MAKPMERLFKPQNTKKYIGKNLGNIILRSSWELIFAMWLDVNPNILQWASESIAVDYFDPVKNRKRKYWVDFIVVVPNPNGGTTTTLVEIKPEHQTMMPVNEKAKSYKNALATYATNKAKWESAEEYANKRGWHFKIFTENDMGL